MKTTRQRMAGMALVLVLLIGSGVRADEAEEKGVKAIEALGGTVIRNEEADGKPVVAVLLSHTQVTDAGLKELAPLTELQALHLRRTQVTNAGLKELGPGGPQEGIAGNHNKSTAIPRLR